MYHHLARSGAAFCLVQPSAWPSLPSEILRYEQ